MYDLISRQAVIDAVNKICDRCGKHKKYDGVMCGTCYLDGVADIIEDLPSAQPEHALTADDIETIRIHLNAFKEKLCNQRRWNEAKEYEDLINRLLSTSSESQWTDSENTANETEK